jgi:hypothetical protein
MTPLDILREELKVRYMWRCIMGKTRAYVDAPFTVAEIMVYEDSCSGVEILFLNQLWTWGTPERLPDGKYTDPVPPDLVLSIVRGCDELPAYL